MSIAEIQPELNEPQHFEVFSVGNHILPVELVSVVAYWKWCHRCNEVGQEVHGFDQSDWYEAEQEIRTQINSVSWVDYNLFLIGLSPSELTPCDEDVRTRAYFLAHDEEGPFDSEIIWQQAVTIEKELLFARLFIEFCFRRGQISVFSPEDSSRANFDT